MYISIKETKHLMMLTLLTAFRKLIKSFNIVNSSGDNTRKDRGRERRRRRREREEREEE
jgi:hypothetical protein